MNESDKIKAAELRLRYETADGRTWAELWSLPDGAWMVDASGEPPGLRYHGRVAAELVLARVLARWPSKARRTF